MKKTKNISRAVYLQALALFTMANQNSLRANAYGEALADLLGYKDKWAGGFGDGWLDEKPNFDAILKNEDFTTRAAPIKKPKRKR
jgi:hypothetical protein